LDTEPLHGGGRLWAHVLRRADHHARLGESLAAGGLECERDPEVGDDRLAVVDQDVLGLVSGEFHRARDLELFLALEDVAERLPFDEGHHIEEESVGDARVVEWEDVRVLEARGDLDLLEESVGADDRAEFWVEDFEGDLAVVAEVLGEEDGGHASAGGFAVDAVAVGEAASRREVEGRARGF